MGILRIIKNSPQLKFDGLRKRSDALKVHNQYSSFFGINDLSGNVGEWVSYDDDYVIDVYKILNGKKTGPLTKLWIDVNKELLYKIQKIDFS